MARFTPVLIFAVLCVLGSLTRADEDGNSEWSPVTQHKPHEHNHRRNNNHQHNHDDHKEPTWVSCDFTISPRMRCHDCHTRLICKRIGGLLLDCPSSYAPYCNNGLCSPVPSMECA